jgi:hypothetical protein
VPSPSPRTISDRGDGSATDRGSAAASGIATQSPATAPAGSVVPLTVTLHDAFGNLATTYGGTVRLTASDARAVLPPDVTYVPATDAGSHAFSASLLTAGSQVLTATDLVDATITCNATVLVMPGAPRSLSRSRATRTPAMR